MKGGSVPPLRVTSYCWGVSCARHSASLLVTFSTMSADIRGGPGGYKSAPGAADKASTPDVQAIHEVRQQGFLGRRELRLDLRFLGDSRWP